MLVARLGDRTIGACSIHGAPMGGLIITASSDVVANDRGVARLGDIVLADCNCVSNIITAASTVITNDRGTARLQDRVAGASYTAVIVTGSPDVNVDDLVNIGGIPLPPDQNSPANAESLIIALGYSAIDDEYETNDGQDVYPPVPQTAPPGPITESPVDENNTPAPDSPTPVTDCTMITTPVDYSFQLSPNFKLEQLSIKAVFPHAIKAQNGLSLSEIVCNLKALAEHVLEPIVAQYPGARVNSGFRTRQNGRSQHEKGQAVDLQWPGLSYDELWEIVNWVKDNVNYDQLLWEHGNSPWIHVSFNTAGNRPKNAANAVMTMYNNKFSPGLKKMQ